MPVRIDLMEVSSYGGTATESSGLVRILKDLSREHRRRGRPAGRGHHRYRADPELPASATCAARTRASLRICTLLDKPARRLVDIPVDYTGFTIEDQFVVGYGLDYGELYRNLRFVGVLRPEVYSGGG